MLADVPPQALDLSGQDQPSPRRPRQPDRRRRSRRASGLGRQGARRERHRRRRAAPDDPRRAGRQEAGPRRGRRRGHGAGRCAAGDRAARDQQDPARRRSRGDPDARVPRRGAAVDRVGLAFRPAHARERAGERHRDPRQRRHRRVDRRGRRAAGHAGRGQRRVLQPAGAAEVPEVRRRRVGAGVARRHAAGAGVSGGRLHADQRRAARCCSVRRRCRTATGSIRSTASAAT